MPLLSGEIIIAIITVVLAVAFLMFIYKRIDSRIAGLEKSLGHQIKLSLQPEFVEVSVDVEKLTELATEFWRLRNKLEEFESNLKKKQARRLQASIDKLEKYLQNYDVEVVDYTGEKFNEGLSVDVLSYEQDSEVDGPVIKETVEPTILCKDKVTKKGTVIVANKGGK